MTLRTRKVMHAEQVGSIASGIFRHWTQGDTTRQEMRAVWWLLLDCGHRRQCAAVVPPERYSCLECDVQLSLPLDLPRHMETWR